MINQENIEKLYDVIDESAIILFDKYKIPYLKGIVKTCENIYANSADFSDKEINEELETLLNSIKDITFQKEEIRKAIQYAILKGLKHEKISNQMITPESIGVLMSYFIEKLYDKKSYRIYDPLLGTGNLITTVANQIEKDVELIGVDNFGISYELAQSLFSMLGYGDKVFFQDTLTSKNINADVIISDFSAVQQDQVYKIIDYQLNNLKPDGYFIFMVDNTFFKELNVKEFIKVISENWYLFGMVVLPNEVFKNQEKSMVILQNRGINFIQPDSFLMAEIPSFTDKEGLNKVIRQLNNWFNKTQYYKVEE
ncbi:MAG: class I SAM-dependent methyltransferase [Bacillota bacterium]